ncbi:hypothetical protein GCM10009083_23960 [Halopseudomonas pertucinogena]|uniref:Uncharacterized protein n=1 Tax=Halopseudomonas pertucinogena TaxID=86175 RepID=A0ABQ2CRL1_9GAMM|nr:hypothetical protein GCM10009083_23960 [Halopseudomonas pertucinogena]
MSVDLSNGRFDVYAGRGPLERWVGRIDHDEFVRDAAGGLIYRTDGDEFYDMKGTYVGEIEKVEENFMVVSRGPSGVTCLFVIRPE